MVLLLGSKDQKAQQIIDLLRSSPHRNKIKLSQKTKTPACREPGFLSLNAAFQ
jgi:hypothetical protein